MWILPPTFPPSSPHPPSSPYPVLPRGTQHTQPVLQGCQAEIPAKKLKRGHKKKISGRILADFYQKQAEKGAAENFQKKFLIFSCDNHV